MKNSNPHYALAIAAMLTAAPAIAATPAPVEASTPAAAPSVAWSTTTHYEGESATVFEDVLTDGRFIQIVATPHHVPYAGLTPGMSVKELGQQYDLGGLFRQERYDVTVELLDVAGNAQRSVEYYVQLTGSLDDLHIALRREMMATLS